MQSVPLLIRQSLRAHLQVQCAGARSIQVPRIRAAAATAFADRPNARSFSICGRCRFRQLSGSFSPLDEKEKDRILEEARKVSERTAPEVVPEGVPESNTTTGTPYGSSPQSDSPSTWQTETKPEDEGPTGEEKQTEQKQKTEARSAALGSLGGGLPSYLENRRSQLSKQFTTMMDTMQANVFVAGQRLNDLTGYSAIEVLKKDIQDQEDRLREARAQVRKAKENYTAAINNRSTSQREVNELLQRKHAWSPTDLERFTLLYRNDHTNEVAETETQEALSRAEREAEEAAAALNKSILSRYHEEQVWSDKIRRMSTWGTWGLMGVNVLLFLIFQIAVEPWRRSRLVKGFEDKVVEALEKEKHLNHFSSAAPPSAATTTTSTTLPEVIDSEIETSVAAMESPKDESTKTAPTPSMSSMEASSALLEPIPEQSLYTRVTNIPWAPITTEYWRQVIDELFAERTVSLSQRDITVATLQSAAAGAVLTSLLLAILRPR
ncbi:Uncharacterized protein PECH_003113 [Penicillium ucsense]|uniref:Sensitive to high expression protein 9, mitochondrial n=1 Tax=Penicillium ucsense TaxID=2839758 RepID=A0A8J8WLS3_9EURO|nr:Uncharacterized protein PECM_001880 [Penicillium ucsense]KAF7729822.1 Uncharacterized protein PECH_003113 [Penicillium ucsense]